MWIYIFYYHVNITIISFLAAASDTIVSLYLKYRFIKVVQNKNKIPSIYFISNFCKFAWLFSK